MSWSADTDARWMARALALAEAQLGKTAPNPAVGCVIIVGDSCVAEAATGDGGRPHAEERALADAGEAARGACAYVTLEPCGERSSETRSCSERLIEAGVSRVVVACPDPHPKGAGGMDRLRAAGVECVSGVMRDEAEALNAGFFKHVETGRPWVAVDADPAPYDADFFLDRGESFEAALDRMGREGLTRVRIAPGSPIALALKSRGLLDAEV